MSVYELIRGPLVWASFAIFFLGLLIQGVRFIKATEKADPRYLPKIKKKKTKKGQKARKKRRLNFSADLEKWFNYFKNSVLGNQPLVMAVSIVFHILLFVIPLLALGHNTLFKRSIGFGLFSLPDVLTDILTFLFLLCAFFFLARRIFIRRVRAISSLYDIIVWIIAVAPYLTGFLAYHQWFDYKTIMTIHIIAGEIMLVAIPFTKLGHMIYFFFYRFFVGSEHSFGQGSRTW